MTQGFTAALSNGAPLEPHLAAAGESEPGSAARAFARAALHLDLARQLDAWAPALLRTARPGFGAQCLEEIAIAWRALRHEPLDLSRHPALPLVLGSSHFLARILMREPAWVEELAGDPPAAPTETPEPEWDAIRAVKYRGLLRIAARDLLGRPFAAALGELSELADRCLHAAWHRAAQECDADGPVLFALGKLGGSELNFSSDVDLLFVYEPPPESDDLAHNEDAARFVRCLKTNLEVPTPLGFTYRVDLDLRPEGPTGVLANSVEAALGYYESFGAEWERQALLRLRCVVGPDGVAGRFEKGIEPFVYRRAIGADVVQGVHAMKAKIESERRAAGRDVDSELKEGPGGIRDIEFLVQALQLLYAGHDPELRTGNVLDALERLTRAAILDAEVSRSLHDGYLWLRRAEHALQLADERQTQRVPGGDTARLALARRMGYIEPEGSRALAHWRADWDSVRTTVRREFEALVPRSGE